MCVCVCVLCVPVTMAVTVSLSRLSLCIVQGVKQPDATAFPNGASMGATWNPALLVQVGNAVGVEARGIHNSQEDKSGETGGNGYPGAVLYLCQWLSHGVV